MLKSMLALTVAFSLVSFARAADNKAADGGPLSHTVKDIDGKDVDLSTYKGKVVMIVNVASKCGNTPQYKPLEAMYKKYADQGFVILGFPANQFGGQEPGSDQQIKEFCTGTYKVDFPMFSKIVVKGDGIAPLYQELTTEKTTLIQPKGDDKAGASGPITWNFEKFLVGRDGKVIARIAPKVQPDDKRVVEKVEAELAKK